MSQTQSGESGFTLVEALVSLFVFSLIAAGSVLMLTQSVDTHRRVAEAEVSLREVQNVRLVLAADLAQYVGREVREPDGHGRPRFIGGDADTPLAFVRAAGEPDPERGARTRLALVEYDFEDGSIVRRTRTALDVIEQQDMATRVLVADAGEARFEFFDGVTWREQWLAGSAGSSPPRAVALVFHSSRYGEVRIEALVGLG
nr:type II secretion system minor pseudopilin GspJ [Nitrosomonas nitrosa]